MYVQNSIFLSFLKNEKIIAFFDTFIFRQRHRKIDNLETVNQFTRQKKFIMLPNDILWKI